MRKMVLPAPDLHILEASLDNFPEGFMWPYTAIVREGYKSQEAAIQAGESFEFTIPQYGVLTFHGREYTFVPSKAYRTTKRYPDEISGRWG